MKTYFHVFFYFECKFFHILNIFGFSFALIFSSFSTFVSKRKNKTFPAKNTFLLPRFLWFDFSLFSIDRLCALVQVGIFTTIIAWTWPTFIELFLIFCFVDSRFYRSSYFFIVHRSTHLHDSIFRTFFVVSSKDKVFILHVFVYSLMRVWQLLWCLFRQIIKQKLFAKKR